MTTNLSTKTLQPIIMRAGEGETLHVFDDVIQVKFGSIQTAGNMTVVLATPPPRWPGPPPHIHHREDELFVVQEGRIELLVGDEWVELGPGDTSFTPRGALHTFRNVGDSIGRIWIILTPSGFESFFRKSAEVFAADGPPDMGRIMAIAQEHGLEFRLPS